MTIRYDIDAIYYAKHYPRDESKLPTLRVDYYENVGASQAKVLSEYICIYHNLSSFARQKADEWCALRGVTIHQMKNYIEGGLEDLKILEPSAVHVDDSGQFPRAEKFEWSKRYEIV